jgi:hypothetical protein
MQLRSSRFQGRTHFFVVAVTLSFVPGTAFAYLDPGLGSMFLQGAIALIGSVLTTIVLYWKAVKAFIRSIFTRKSHHKSHEGREDS